MILGKDKNPDFPGHVPHSATGIISVLSYLMMHFNLRLLTGIMGLALLHLACQHQNEVSGRTESIDQALDEYPHQMQFLIESIDWSRSDLKKGSAFLAAGDSTRACLALLEHLQTVDRDWVINTLDSTTFDEAPKVAEDLMVDSVNLYGMHTKVPRKKNGGWLWNYTGPIPDDEFGYSLNGHKYLPALYLHFLKTRNEKFISKLDEILRDWIVQHPLPDVSDSIYLVLDPQVKLDYRDIGEVEWRTLETGHRLGASWPQLYFGLVNNHSFSDLTRLLMLSSIAMQSDFLMVYHKKRHNWTTMEMNGLALAGLTFTAFKNSEKWGNYAMETMSEEINKQVYPDGTQTELSTKTQWVALHRFETITDNFKKAGKTVSDQYEKRLLDMYRYLAYSIRPDGHQPLNNDSDRDDLRDILINAAQKFSRPDWSWIATNGKAGEEPKMGPSIVFPWAGIHIMRDSWEKNAHWTFFDTGPYGTGHQHRDKLHLSISVSGYDFLVDGGRFTHENYFSFDPTEWRGYFRSSYSHNVILIDHSGQKAGSTTTKKPITEGVDYLNTEKYDYARGTFDAGFEGVTGPVEHKRSVFYLKNRFWIVLDQIKTDRPRKIDVLWHFSPRCTVQKKEGFHFARIGKTYLQVVPINKEEWRTELIKGQTDPVIQGWYSSFYGKKEPNPTLIFSNHIDDSVFFAWLIIPTDTDVLEYSASMKKTNDHNSFTITGDDQIHKINLPMAGKSAVNMYDLDEL